LRVADGTSVRLAPWPAREQLDDARQAGRRGDHWSRLAWPIVKRELYNAEHLAFQESVREFIKRSIRPHTDEYITNASLPRDLWLQAGKDGFLGLQVPAVYGGSEANDYRFNTSLAQAAVSHP
jgi:alkylation response protein AidB-like acyl-CoA dehydrogenase